MEREIVGCTIKPEEKKDSFDGLIEVHITNVWRVLRVCAWVQRLISNLKLIKVSRNLEPLTTKELKEQQEWWIKRVQQGPGNVDSFQTDRVQLNLRENEQGILKCRERIVGQYSIYLPDGAPFTPALVHEAIFTRYTGEWVLLWRECAKRYGFRHYGNWFKNFENAVEDVSDFKSVHTLRHRLVSHLEI